jgi:hypothetical protein
VWRNSFSARIVKDLAFGRTELPRKQAGPLRAIRLGWITIGFLVVAVTLVGLVLGDSQSMKGPGQRTCCRCCLRSRFWSPCGSSGNRRAVSADTDTTGRWGSASGCSSGAGGDGDLAHHRLGHELAWGSPPERRLLHGVMNGGMNTGLTRPQFGRQRRGNRGGRS